MKTVLLIITISFFSMTLTAQDYFPLSLGYSWNYTEYTDSLVSDVYQIQIIDYSNRADSFVLYTVEKSFETGDSEFIFYYDKLDLTWAVQVGFKEPGSEFIAYSHDLFKHSYSEGESFEFILNEAVATSRENVTTFTGNEYEDCWNLYYQHEEQNFILCKDIGLVQIESIGNPQITELNSYSVDAVLSTHNITSDVEIIISPNPTTDQLNISTDQNNENDLSIINLKAQKVLEISYFQKINIDISQLPSGQYFIFSFDKKTKNFWLKPFIKN